jgi:hypothetical protein
VFTCKHEEEARIWSISHREEQVEGEQDRWPVSKIDLCVILHISSQSYGCIVTLWCINDDCNMCVCVCDFASQEICLCDYLYAVQFFVWFTYSLASMKKNKPTRAG